MILLYQRFVNECLVGMNSKWFYNTNVLEMILQQEWIGNYFSIGIHC